jgi:Sel1 repeat/Caspase domain
MERTIDRVLVEADREDTVLIFFAGHGLKRENGKLYFAAVDTEPGYLGSTAMSAAWLMEQMQSSQVRRQIVLLDCCFGGAFARGNVWRGDDRVESGKALEVPNLDLEGRGQVVITAADAMQFAFEGAELNGKPPASHFVRALTEGLETGDADRIPQDGRITIDELVSYLVTKLRTMGSPQRPTKWAFGEIGGDLLFAYNARIGVGSDHLSTLPVDWKQQVERYIESKDYVKAVLLSQKAVDVGNTEGMIKLGEVYKRGWGVAKDYGKARELFQKAADAGSTDAMTDLGLLYDCGYGVAQDYGKACEWYQRAADGGDGNAMNILAEHYERGQGVAKDHDKAREWYQKAEDAGKPYIGWGD